MILRIALTAEPIPSHVCALDYVIRPARQQGHRVVLHGPLMFRRAASWRGMEFHCAGTSWTCDPVVQRTASETWTRSGNAAFNRYVFGHLWPQQAETKAEHLLSVWTRARPDLVIAECSDLGAHLAARVLDLPLVAADNGLGPVLLGLWDTDVAPALAPLHKRYEQGPPALPPMLTPAPAPWFYGTFPPGVRPVPRTLAEHRAAGVPAGTGRSPSARPLVYVSLGTLTTAHPRPPHRGRSPRPCGTSSAVRATARPWRPRVTNCQDCRRSTSYSCGNPYGSPAATRALGRPKARWTRTGPVRAKPPSAVERPTAPAGATGP
ncbi:hypothetical protein [Streptomyces naphthomycinicus]|uniref:hypothetical protein n=1 Tax=Streptomyces naphthomycinicus TaxID=2872625 RepID=UPI001CEC2EAC|nr:hypothetical protein [Streptomyces sp. TML10]